MTSNPSPAYISRVASIFKDNGLGVRGDMKAVITAVLLDPEARNSATDFANPQYGKVREALLRFLGPSPAGGHKFPVSMPAPGTPEACRHCLFRMCEQQRLAMPRTSPAPIASSI